MTEVNDEVLIARARALARPRAAASPPASSDEVVSFRVRRARYAVDAAVVLGVRRVVKISPVPRAAEIAGLTVIDGEIVSVVRLDSVGPVETTAAPLAIVLGHAKPELALLVDEVDGIRPRDVAGQDANEAIVHLDGVALLRTRGR